MARSLMVLICRHIGLNLVEALGVEDSLVWSWDVRGHRGTSFAEEQEQTDSFHTF